MNGLAEIIAINEHAAAKAREDSRRKRGLKPADAVGAVLRKTTHTLSARRCGKRQVMLQGRSVEI